MNISPTASFAEPSGTQSIPTGTLAYFRLRLKQRMYDAIIHEFMNAGLSKTDLAKRLGKDPAEVSELLSGPGGLTLEAASDLLFGIAGAEPTISTGYPLRNRGEVGSSRLPTANGEDPRRRLADDDHSAANGSAAAASAPASP